MVEKRRRERDRLQNASVKNPKALHTSACRKRESAIPGYSHNKKAYTGLSGKEPVSTRLFAEPVNHAGGSGQPAGSLLRSSRTASSPYRRTRHIGIGTGETNTSFGAEINGVR